MRSIPEGLGSLDSVLDILELRMAVESEAAAIASERATAAQIKAIGEAHRVFSRAISSGDRAIKEDFAFHQAIAAATKNSRFAEFLDFLGRLIIPRQSIRSFEGTAEGLRQYLARIGREPRGDLSGDRRPFAEKSARCDALASRPRAASAIANWQAARVKTLRLQKAGLCA